MKAIANTTIAPSSFKRRGPRFIHAAIAAPDKAPTSSGSLFHALHISDGTGAGPQ